MNEFRTALKELEDLFDIEDSRERDSKRKLLTDKFKLQGLYEKHAKDEDEDEKDCGENVELKAIIEMLEPLGLAKPGTSASELVRLLIMSGINTEK
jgi:hypothetical protein